MHKGQQFKYPTVGSPQIPFCQAKPGRRPEKLYKRATDYLEVLDIYVDTPDEMKREWKEVMMIFQGDDKKTLQALEENNTITQEIQHTPELLLDTIQTTIKEDRTLLALYGEISIRC